jgi:hypothetical protein
MGVSIMNKIAILLAAVALILSPQLCAIPAFASSLQTFVSVTGNDSNVSTNCQSIQPCQTIDQAFTVTTTGGRIACLDTGLFLSFPFTITRPVTIDCHERLAGMQFGTNCTGDGIVINAPGGGIVTLRNLTITSFADTGSPPCGVNGVTIKAASTVNIENCLIEQWAGRGINDVRTTGGAQLVVKNTVVRDNGAAGIVAAAAATNSVMLENVESTGNAFGLAVATGNHVAVSRSIMFGNATAGVEVDPGGQLYVDYTEIANNGTGAQAYGNIALGNSGIVSNTTGITGTTTSYGNNRIFANFAAGTAPTPIGGASPDYGQQ